MENIDKKQLFIGLGLIALGITIISVSIVVGGSAGATLLIA